MLVELVRSEALDIGDAIVEPDQILLELLPLLLLDLDEHIVCALLELLIARELRLTLSLS